VIEGEKMRGYGGFMHIPNLISQAEFSDEGPQRKAIYDAPEMRSVLFSLKSGQEVKPHIVSSEVVMYVISGEGSFRVGSETPDVKGGSLVVCKPNEAHGIMAKSDMVVLVAIVHRQ
jgi:quercetin dioxygenase-like cupin family protein